jgi:hypothetical protein
MYATESTSQRAEPRASRASQPLGPLLARLLRMAPCLRAEPTPWPARLTPHLARLGSAQLGPLVKLGEPARLFANPEFGFCAFRKATPGS